MKTKTKVIWAVTVLCGLLLGITIGAFATYQVSIQPFQKALAGSYISDTMHHVVLASKLRTAKQPELAHELDKSFPANVQMIRNIYGNHPMSAKALRSINNYYQKHNLPIPTEIKPTLAALPSTSNKEELESN